MDLLVHSTSTRQETSENPDHCEYVDSRRGNTTSENGGGNHSPVGRQIDMG
jgi:hypothetical protein